MRNRVALFVVTVAVIGLVLTGCGRGPGTKPPPTMPPTEPPTEPPTMPSIDGTWVFTGFSATIAVPDVTVTVGVGDGVTPLGEESPLSSVLQITAKGTLTMDGTTYKLALAEGEEAIIVELAPDAAPVLETLAKTFIKNQIESAQDGNVTITVSEDMMMITVKGSFLDKLAETLGMTVPDEGLKGCKAPCSTMPS